MTQILHLLALALAAAAAGRDTEPEASFRARCEAFPQHLRLEGVDVHFAQFVQAGEDVQLDGNPPSCGQSHQPAAAPLCRVALSARTSATSAISLEAWLPRSWSGRFLVAGNSGLSGCVPHADLAYGAGLGFAAVGTNNGHNGTSAAPLLGDEEAVTDFAWRSVHAGAEAGKAVTDAFYGSRGRGKSYFVGCSTGGRQAHKAAQMWPGDFDGILGGCAAIEFGGLLAWSLWLGMVTGFDVEDPGFVPAHLWDLVGQEVLRQCDALDGAADGIIEDPDACVPDLAPLLCRGRGGACLSAEQVRRAGRVYQPLRDSRGAVLYPRMQPGGESVAARQMYTGAPFPFSEDWFRHVVYNDTAWDATAATLADLEALVAQDPAGVAAFDPDLAAFRARGGKFVAYHGLQDTLISSDNSARYYGHVMRAMGLSPPEVDGFYRSFRVAGLAHCVGGPGAWSLGQVAVGGPRPDPHEDNVLMALVRWVEDGAAPDVLRGVKYVDDDPGRGVAFRRSHCRYPAHNVYVGPGNWTDEGAWQCTQPRGPASLVQQVAGAVLGMFG